MSRSNGETSATLYEAFFDLTIQICKEFPQFTPLQIRKESAEEMCIFIARFLNKKIRENANGKPNHAQNIIEVGKNKVQYYEDNSGDWVF